LFEISGLEVAQQSASLAHHHEQATSRAVIFSVFLKVLGKMINPLGQQCNLHGCRPGIAFVQPKFSYCFVFRFHSV